MHSEDQTSQIFCVGLCETGVEALVEALGVVGVPVRFRPSVELMSKGRFPEALAGTRGAAGPPTAAMFRELDLAYPNSRFILTTRTAHDWLEAMERRANAGELEGECETLYGSLPFHRDAMAATYELHKASVIAHFVGREDELLVMDLYSGAGWDVLCPFLNVRVPRRAFPAVERYFDQPLRLVA